MAAVMGENSLHYLVRRNTSLEDAHRHLLDFPQTYLIIASNLGGIRSQMTARQQAVAEALACIFMRECQDENIAQALSLHFQRIEANLRRGIEYREAQLPPDEGEEVQPHPAPDPSPPPQSITSTQPSLAEPAEPSHSPVPEAESCTICLAPFPENEQIGGLVCGHYFHRQCIENLSSYFIEQDPPCPNCRTPFQTANVTYRLFLNHRAQQENVFTQRRREEQIEADAAFARQLADEERLPEQQEESDSDIEVVVVTHPTGEPTTPLSLQNAPVTNPTTTSFWQRFGSIFTRAPRSDNVQESPQFRIFRKAALEALGTPDRDFSDVMDSVLPLEPLLISLLNTIKKDSPEEFQACHLYYRGHLQKILSIYPENCQSALECLTDRIHMREDLANELYLRVDDENSERLFCIHQIYPSFSRENAALPTPIPTIQSRGWFSSPKEWKERVAFNKAAHKLGKDDNHVLMYTKEFVTLRDNYLPPLVNKILAEAPTEFMACYEYFFKELAKFKGSDDPSWNRDGVELVMLLVPMEEYLGKKHVSLRYICGAYLETLPYSPWRVKKNTIERLSDRFRCSYYETTDRLCAKKYLESLNIAPNSDP